MKSYIIGTVHYGFMVISSVRYKESVNPYRLSRSSDRMRNFRYRIKLTVRCITCGTEKELLGSVALRQHTRCWTCRPKVLNFNLPKPPIRICDTCGRRHIFPYHCRLKSWNDIIASLPVRVCEWCEIEYQPCHPIQKYCCKTCSKNAMHIRRGKHMRERCEINGVVYRPIKTKKIYDRDGGICQICFLPVPWELRGTFVDNAPELDHIIPLSKAKDLGYAETSHSEAFVRIAHRKCNRDRNYETHI